MDAFKQFWIIENFKPIPEKIDWRASMGGVSCVLAWVAC